MPVYGYCLPVQSKFLESSTLLGELSSSKQKHETQVTFRLHRFHKVITGFDAKNKPEFQNNQLSTRQCQFRA